MVPNRQKNTKDKEKKNYLPKRSIIFWPILESKKVIKYISMSYSVIFKVSVIF